MAKFPKLKDCHWCGEWDAKEAARPEGYDYADLVTRSSRLWVSMVNDNNTDPHEVLRVMIGTQELRQAGRSRPPVSSHPWREVPRYD